MRALSESSTAAGPIQARGPLSEFLLATLAESPRASESSPDELNRLTAQAVEVDDSIRDDDVQLSLFLLYSLHYGSLGFDDAWEWEPALIRCRRGLEGRFEQQVREAVPQPASPAADREAVAQALFTLTGADSGPSLSRFVAKRATNEQLLEFVAQRSIYTLREADPHSWAIPRLTGRAKAALVEIQADEYGGGDAQRVHATMFARTVRGVGLDDTYGAYVDNVPAITLASLNLMSLFGLNRRLRGAIVGHLAAFEMTSAIPNRMYGNGFRRLGFGDDVTDYFDEHVEADAVHEQIAGRDLAGSLAEDEPLLIADIMFGASACLTVDGWAGEHMLERWSAGESSLRVPLAGQ
jgi:hypothetical protein